MRDIILSLILASLWVLALGCSKKSQADMTTKQKKDSHATERSQGKSVTKGKAIEIAKEFLKKQTYANQYRLDSARATDGKDDWNVWFKKVKNEKPSEGLVKVDKKTGKARWQPLK